MSAFSPSEWHKRVRCVGFKLFQWHARKQSVQYHAGIKKKMAASCMLQRQYIESKGVAGQPGVHSDENHLWQILQHDEVEEIRHLLGRSAFICKQWGGIGCATKEEAHRIWHPLSLLPASQHFTSCPLKAARGINLISRLNIVITSD